MIISSLHTYDIIVSSPYAFDSKITPHFRTGSVYNMCCGCMHIGHTQGFSLLSQSWHRPLFATQTTMKTLLSGFTSVQFFCWRVFLTSCSKSCCVSFLRLDTTKGAHNHDRGNPSLFSCLLHFLTCEIQSMNWLLSVGWLVWHLLIQPSIPSSFSPQLSPFPLEVRWYGGHAHRMIIHSIRTCKGECENSSDLMPLSVVDGLPECCRLPLSRFTACSAHTCFLDWCLACIAHRRVSLQCSHQGVASPSLPLSLQQHKRRSSAPLPATESVSWAVTSAAL